MAGLDPFAKRRPARQASKKKESKPKEGAKSASMGDDWLDAWSAPSKPVSAAPDPWAGDAAAQEPQSNPKNPEPEPVRPTGGDVDPWGGAAQEVQPVPGDPDRPKTDDAADPWGEAATKPQMQPAGNDASDSWGDVTPASTQSDEERTSSDPWGDIAQPKADDDAADLWGDAAQGPQPTPEDSDQPDAGGMADPWGDTAQPKADDDTSDPWDDADPEPNPQPAADNDASDPWDDATPQPQSRQAEDASDPWGDVGDGDAQADAGVWDAKEGEDDYDPASWAHAAPRAGEDDFDQVIEQGAEEAASRPRFDFKRLRRPLIILLAILTLAGSGTAAAATLVGHARQRRWDEACTALSESTARLRSLDRQARELGLDAARGRTGACPDRRGDVRIINGQTAAQKDRAKGMERTIKAALGRETAKIRSEAAAALKANTGAGEAVRNWRRSPMRPHPGTPKG